jgi:hypothetical protein
MDKKIITKAGAGAILTPFLIGWGMTLNDVNLSDGKNFANYDKYVEYRTEKLADCDNTVSIDKFQDKVSQITAIVNYEELRTERKLIENAQQYNQAKDNLCEFLRNKF